MLPPAVPDQRGHVILLLVPEKIVKKTNKTTTTILEKAEFNRISGEAEKLTR